MTENTQHWGQFALPPQSLHISIDGWRIQYTPSGRALLWVVPGYTHVIGTTN